MTPAEFKDEFNVMYQNINKGGAPGLDDYEISANLSQAQEKFVDEMVANKFTDFPGLIQITTVGSPTASGIDSGYSFNLPTDWLEVLNANVSNAGGEVHRVIPVTDAEYQIGLSKPYSYPPRRRAWRLPKRTGLAPSLEIRTRPGFIPTSLQYFTKKNII